MSYDSRPDTYEHIQNVQKFMGNGIKNLMDRAEVHDRSKLESPEVELFDEWTPKLKDVTYNSPEYKEFLANLKPALDHHYARNSHHPESHRQGIRDMTLLDLFEMLCDWKAATLRHNDGNIRKSIDINAERFKFHEFDLAECFRNTLKEIE